MKIQLMLWLIETVGGGHWSTHGQLVDTWWNVFQKLMHRPSAIENCSPVFLRLLTHLMFRNNSACDIRASCSNGWKFIWMTQNSVAMLRGSGSGQCLIGWLPEEIWYYLCILTPMGHSSKHLSHHLTRMQELVALHSHLSLTKWALTHGSLHTLEKCYWFLRQYCTLILFI